MAVIEMTQVEVEATIEAGRRHTKESKSQDGSPILTFLRQKRFCMGLSAHERETEKKKQNFNLQSSQY